MPTNAKAEWDNTWAHCTEPAWPEYTNLRIDWFRQKCVEIRNIENVLKPTVVEIGAGSGWVTRDLCGIFKECVYVCADISPYALQQIEELNLPNVKTTPMSKLLETGRIADIVICGDVLEHVEDRQSFFETITATVKQGGHFFLSTPNRFMPILFLRMLFGKKATEQPYDCPVSKEELEKMLASYNFDILDCRLMSAEARFSEKCRSQAKKTMKGILLTLVKYYLQIKGHDTRDAIMVHARYMPDSNSR